MDDGFVCRLRGLPWSATADDVVEFFGENVVRIVPNGVHFTFSREGRPSGEAFIELESEEDIEQALTRHKDHMGQRYIEVFRSKRSEMDWVVKRSSRNQPQSGEAVLRLRGLPFGCSKEEIAQFFSGLELVPNGIMLPEDRHGRTTGDAYVQFSSPDIAEKALLKHKERIGHRYIEIFKSSLNEASANIVPDYGMAKPRPLMGMRPGPYNRNERMMGGGMNSGGGMGMGNFGYGRGRGRNLKGFYEDDYEDDMGFVGNMGGGGRMGMGNMGGGGIGMGMNRRGNMRQQGMQGGGGGRMGGDRMGGGGGGGMMRSSQPGCHYISKTGHSVHMRGLPFQANDQDVADFFSPLVPVKVEFEFNAQGRPTGEANVDFSTHQEAKEAMKKHKANMQHRYIELFLNSTPSNRSDGMFGGDDFQDEGGMDMMDIKPQMRKGNMGGFGGGNMSNMGGGDGFSGMSGGNMRGRMNNNPNYTAF